PFLRILYCNPEAVTCTPEADLFLARKAAPSFLFFAATLSNSALALARNWVRNALRTLVDSSLLMVGFLPDSASLTALATIDGSTSSRTIAGSVLAKSHPTT